MNQTLLIEVIQNQMAVKTQWNKNIETIFHVNS